MIIDYEYNVQSFNVCTLHNIYMLNRATKLLGYGFAIEKKLFVYDSGTFDPFVSSGIRATIFGATGISNVIKD